MQSDAPMFMQKNVVKCHLGTCAYVCDEPLEIFYKFMYNNNNNNNNLNEIL